ncbi:MAG TPA: MASE1 domain-containing protein [Polyangia bacterium]|nr:MASE1 domain-containing protein [Polyangia bacterium]
MAAWDLRLGRRALELSALFAAYVVTARLGLTFDALGGIATTVWPPTGIALAALLLGGIGLWPAITLGAFVANLLSHIPVWAAALVAAGNTLEALFATVALRRTGFDRRLARVVDVLLLVGVAAVGSTAISAAVGLAAARLAHIPAAGHAGGFFAVWWVGDALGDLLIAPLILAFADRPELSRRPLRWIEVIALAVATVVAGFTVFRHEMAWDLLRGLSRGTYLLAPVLIWAAVRFEQRGVTITLLLLCTIGVSGALQRQGVVDGDTLHDRLLFIQGYAVVTAASMLMLGAALAERRAAIGARDEFISIASHELKTPLTALKLRLGSAERAARRLSQADAINPQVDKVLRSVVAAGATADRLDALVDDLLDVSRLSAGRLALRLESFDAGGLLADVAGRAREQAAEVGSTIDLLVAGPIVGAWDRSRLEQVVTNLLSNAIKYGMGKPIRLGAEALGDRVRIWVEDAGPGIARADQQRIFQAFERLANAQRVGGLGLGLYIGQQIAAAHGGALAVESEPGHGARFTLELPRAPRLRPGGVRAPG